MPSNKMETPRLTWIMLRKPTIDSNSKPLTVQKFFSLLSKLCKSKATSFTIDGNSIKQVEFTKSFGVYIDENRTYRTYF